MKKHCLSLLLLCAIVLGFAAPALAQADPSFATDMVKARHAPRYNVQYWRPSPMPGDYLTTHGTMVEEEWRVTGGFYLNYALNPLINPIGQSESASSQNLVKNQVYLDLFASISMFKFLEFSVVMPFALYMDTDAQKFDAGDDEFAKNAIGNTLGGGTSGVGDMRFLLKGKILDINEYPVGLALIADLSAPTGRAANEYTMMGDNGVTFAITAALELNPWAKSRIAFNLGYRYRPVTNVYERHPGQAIIIAGGATIPFFLDDLDFIADLRGEININDQVNLSRDAQERPFEADFAFRYRFIRDPESWARNLAMTIGVGTGTTSIGVPDVRAFLGLSFHWVNGAAPVLDAEYGGFISAVDPCPDPDTTPADLIPDRCKRLEADSDGDTIVDSKDACPFKGRVGHIDDNGCPPDRDGDGYADYEDLCPDEGIEVNGYIDKNGCPAKDSDGDGLYDHLDKCPYNPETINGYEDDDGCPDADPDAKVALADGKINIKEQVFFETSKAVIKKESYDLLNQVAQLLIDNPHIGNVTVEGHTDSRGKHKSNMKLSDDRAKSVRKYLVDRGVAPERLNAIGYGPDRPIDTNDTAEGRQNNRRVEFVVLGLPEDSETGDVHVTD